MGIENIIEGVIVASEEGLVSIDAGGKVMEAVSDYLVGEELCACVRAEDITLALSPASSSARNSFIEGITRVVSLGHSDALR